MNISNPTSAVVHLGQSGSDASGSQTKIFPSEISKGGPEAGAAPRAEGRHSAGQTHGL